ncbi:amino acid permease [Siccibacter turicensis]|uniref:amino acid permease n=1 Tax=Siccibacter turicensis TaxID=357233 RepID=UPI0015E7516B|nr:AAA family ATPase [Siccibacter turicensis]
MTMTTQKLSGAVMSASPRWSLKDAIWILSVYAATVGAGTLFLPVEIGTRGPMVFFMLLLLGFPLSMVPHVLVGRLFMRDGHTADRNLPMFGAFFGPKGREAIKIYFCVAHFPVTLVFAISLVNALDNLFTERLQMTLLPRGALAVIVPGLLFLVLSKGRDSVVRTLSALALPFALTILAIALVQIPDWELSNVTHALRDTNTAPPGETLKHLWLTLPLVTFAFCSTPMISPLAAWYRERGNGGETKAVLIIRLAYVLIFFSIVFFVLSCILAIPRDTFVMAKAQNLNVLSVMKAGDSADLLFWIAPLIAILGMTKSFLGVCLSVAETCSGLVAGALGASDPRGEARAKRIAYAGMFVLTAGVVYLNPNVVTLIETVCGPLIAIFLFLIPAWLIYTRPQLRELRGPTAITVILGGVLTVSALLYGIVF